MEGCASNFDHVLSDFTQRLDGAKYVTVDMELTGTDLEFQPDRYAETAQERLSKLSRIAEQHVPIQIGFTIVSLDGAEQLVSSSYNFYAFPYVGPENASCSPKFACQVSALKFNAKNNVDFNKWIRDGVPYMSRENESKYLQHPASQNDTDLPSKVGLLRLWKVLCDAQLPLVVHCPLDLFFLLACFEQAPLPSESPQEMAALIRRCSPCVFDTAYLHGFLGGFKRLGLSAFLSDAKARHTAEVENGSAEACSFMRDSATAAFFNKGDIHTAGYDSLLTAELFAYLVAISPDLLQECANRLYLYKSAEYLDLNLAVAVGDVGGSLFDTSRETPLVATLAVENDRETPKLIAKAGFKYDWMDSLHVLVIAKVPCVDALSEVARLRVQAPGVAQWSLLSVWRLQARVLAHSTCDRPTDVSSESSAPPLLPDVGDAACTPARKASAWLGDSDVVEQRFVGVIKSFRPAQGFGFIECAESFARFHRDVFLHHTQLGRCTVGHKVCFKISTNSSGHPQAKGVTAADLCSCGPESTAGDSVFGRSLWDDDDDTSRGSVSSEGDHFVEGYGAEKFGEVCGSESDFGRLGVLTECSH